ncbi:MAG TPA: hypothetical protein VLL04_04090 [Rhizomicrobium sp.]|nr:hypothetical protein [Rhizomicrobium sp.]
MTIAIGAETAFADDRLSGASRSNLIDRWIYVFTAASFIAIVLTGFIPDSLQKVAAIHAGQRPPFPLVLHIHAVLMASFLALLLAQTVLVATGRRALHMQLGVVALGLTPVIVITGFILAPTIYHSVWNAAQAAPPPAKQQLQGFLPVLENILLLQIQAGILFSIYMWIALGARRRDPGLHKRMILLAVTAVLAAAIDRMAWLPTTAPGSPLATELYCALTVAPLFLWDVIRNRRIHRAWLIWAAFYVPGGAVVYAIWNTPFWHATARHIMGV